MSRAARAGGAALALLAAGGCAMWIGPSVGGRGEPASPFEITYVDVASQRMAFAVWAPPGADRRREWPAIVALHGSGECGTDGHRQTTIGLGAELVAHPERWPFVVILPQKPLVDQEWEEREDLVFAALRSVRRHWNIDPDRIALTGFSQGGHGTWALGARYPGQWSCLVPLCGYGRSLTMARAWRLPIRAFHGAKDDVVDPRESERIVAGLRERQRRAGIGDDDPRAARLTILPDAGHGIMDEVYSDPALPKWILAQRRPAGERGR